MPVTPQDCTNIAAAVVNRQIDNTTPLWIVLRDLHRQMPVVAQAAADAAAVRKLVQQPPTPAVNVDPVALAAALLADPAGVDRLGAAIAAHLKLTSS